MALTIIKNKNKEHIDSMTIGQGHTIMAGFIPTRVGAKAFSENYYKWKEPTKESLQQLGLFGSDIDYNTYYPDLKAEELKPQSEDFIEPMFRLLSATIVSKNYNPTDFSQPGVLKASMNYLLGQTVNCDHSTDIGNAIGSVSQVLWQEAYKDKGFTIPAGINGVLKIDGKANPRIARGILMEPPSIHSNSVTVQFKWDKSHPDMDDRDFYEKLGTYDEHGNMIRRMVTEVVRYLETSLVSHGADSFAQKIGEDGKIVNPEYAKRSWTSFSEYKDQTKHDVYFIDFKDDTNSFQEGNDTPGINNNNPVKSNSDNMNEELKKFLEKLFGKGMLTLSEGQEKNQETVISCIQELQKKVTNLTTEKNSLAQQIGKKDTEIANLKEMATVGTNYIAKLRETTVANYKKLMGDKADETIVTMLNAETTGLQTILSLNKDYTSRLEEKFPLTCSHCGSHDISRASSVQEPQDGKKEDTTQNSEQQPKSNAEVMDDFYSSKMK